MRVDFEGGEEQCRDGENRVAFPQRAVDVQRLLLWGGHYWSSPAQILSSIRFNSNLGKWSKQQRPASCTFRVPLSKTCVRPIPGSGVPRPTRYQNYTNRRKILRQRCKGAHTILRIWRNALRALLKERMNGLPCFGQK